MSTYRFIAAERAHYPVVLMCSVLEVSTSGFYDWCSRPPSPRSLQDRALIGKIRQIHEGSRRTYGAPRITAELHAMGIRVSRKRVARLMVQARICGVHLRRKWRRPAGKASINAPDLVRRHFDPPVRDRIWAADITYVSTRSGWAHLAVVMDLHSRRIVGWQVAPHLRTELAADALDMAIARRGPAAGLIHHSDNGTQGGFKWSSQHLERGGVDGKTCGLDEGVDWSFADEVPRSPGVATGGRAPVLA